MSEWQVALATVLACAIALQSLLAAAATVLPSSSTAPASEDPLVQALSPPADFLPGGHPAYGAAVALPPGSAFLENRGQFGSSPYLFTGRSAGLDLGFGQSSVSLKRTPLQPSSARADGSVTLTFEGANPVDPTPAEALPTLLNFFLGSDPSRWRSGLAAYRELVYEDLYDGVDLAYAYGPGGVKSEYRLAAGVAPSSVVLSYEGATSVDVSAAGALIVGTPDGPIVESAPVSWQGPDSRRCAYVVLERARVSFVCQDLDGTRPVTIDPLLFATYLGGAGDDRIFGLATDSAGNAYVSGLTTSPAFPTTSGAADTSYNGNQDAFVAKLNASGTGLVYATYIGGTTNWDNAWAIAVDESGNAYVSGTTLSSDFPTTGSAFDTTINGLEDSVIFELNATGSALLYSSYFGGGGDDYGMGIALDPSGFVYDLASTRSGIYTTAGAFDASLNNLCNPCYDGVVSKWNFSASGAAGVVYSTYLGGTGYNGVMSIKADAAGSAYVLGSTRTNDWPVTAGAYDTSFAGGVTDLTVNKFNANGSGLVYSTYLGGTAGEDGSSLAIDAAGNAYVGLSTSSSDFPVTAGASDTSQNGGWDAVVAKISTDGATLLFSTFVGGTGDDFAFGTVLDSQGAVYVAGETTSAAFPVTTDAFDTSLNGTSDAFLILVGSGGATLDYSTYFGGSGTDPARGVAVAPNGSAVVAGYTSSTDFPATAGAFDNSSNGGSWDGFIASLAPSLPLVGPFLLSATSPGELLGARVVNDSVYLGGTSGDLWHSSDSTNWSSIAVGTVGTAHLAFASWNGSWYAAEENASGAGSPLSVLRSTDGGGNWSQVFNDSSSGPVNAFAMEAFGGYLYVATCSAFSSGTARVYRSSDGTSWSVANSSFGSGVCSPQSLKVWKGHLYAARLDGRVLRTADGVVWVTVASPAAPMTFVEAGGELLVGTWRGGSILRSTDGLNWTSAASTASGVETWAGDFWNGSSWWAGRLSALPWQGFAGPLNATGLQVEMLDLSDSVRALVYFDGRLVAGNSRGEIRVTEQVIPRGPSLSVAPAPASAGQRVSLSVAGFAPGALVGLEVDEPAGPPIVLRSVTADAGGAAAFNFTMPTDARGGTYAVFVSGVSLDRKLDGSFLWVLSTTVLVVVQPGVLITVVGPAGPVTPGATAQWSVTVTNNFASSLSIVIALSALAADLTPLLPVWVVASLQAFETTTLSLTLSLPQGAATGTYSIQILALEGLPRDGGAVLAVAESAMEVV